MWQSILIRRHIQNRITDLTEKLGINASVTELTDNAMRLMGDRTRWEAFKAHPHNAYLSKKDKRLNYKISCIVDGVRPVYPARAYIPG